MAKPLGTSVAITRVLAWTIPPVFLLVFFFYPVATLLVTGLASTEGIVAATNALASPAVLGVIWFTIWQATLSTLCVLAVALPGAWVLARLRFRGRGLIEALSVVAFVMPTVVVATAISATLASDGPLGMWLPDGANRGLGAILLSHVYFNVAVVLRMVSSYWAQLDPRVEQVAATLGASPRQVFTQITLPRLRPVILASSSIVFLFTFTSFGIVLLLGNPGQATIEVEIQRQVLFLFNLPVGAVLSVVQMAMVAVILIVQTRLADRITGAGANRALRPPVTTGQRIGVGAFISLGLALFAGPVLLVVSRAFQSGTGFGLGNFQSLTTAREDSVLFVPPVEAVVNSLTYAAAAALIALAVGGLASVVIAGRVRAAGTWEGIWLLPMGVSAVTLGFGILIAFDSPPLNWRGSAVMVPIAQALVALPFVVRALVPAIRAVNPRVRQAAAALGASPARVIWHIELPLIGRSVVVATGFAFAISLGEFGATVFVARGDYPTVPIAIYRLMGTPGTANQGQAMALATILIVLTATVILLTDRWRLPGERHV